MQPTTARCLTIGWMLFVAASIGSAESRTYEICYAHRLTNVTAAPVEQLRIFIPEPASDPFQAVSSFEIELWGLSATVAPRRDVYGQQIWQVAIPRIDPNETIEVGFSCNVELLPVQRVALDEHRVGALDEIPAEIRTRYCADVPNMYALTDPAIQKRARTLAEQTPNPLARVRRIYDLVARELSYERSGGWDSAAEVLARGNGSCSEFSFVFSALCRASGVPTRLVGGSSVRRQPPYEDRVWHRWVEVYLPPWGWVPMDPTRDRKHRPNYRYFGGRGGNLFVLTKVGGGEMLGKQYLAANTHASALKRQRRFYWTQGAADALRQAETLRLRGDVAAANAALGRIVLKHPGSKYARLAAERLRQQDLPVPAPRQPEAERSPE